MVNWPHYRATDRQTYWLLPVVICAEGAEGVVGWNDGWIIHKLTGKRKAERDKDVRRMEDDIHQSTCSLQEE